MLTKDDIDKAINAATEKFVQEHIQYGVDSPGYPRCLESASKECAYYLKAFFDALGIDGTEDEQASAHNLYMIIKTMRGEK